MRKGSRCGAVCVLGEIWRPPRCWKRKPTFMSIRISRLFRLGAVRRLPIPDGSWEPDSTSDLGTLEASDSPTTTTAVKSDGWLLMGYTRCAIGVMIETEPLETY